MTSRKKRGRPFGTSSKETIRCVYCGVGMKRKTKDGFCSNDCRHAYEFCRKIESENAEMFDYRKIKTAVIVRAFKDLRLCLHRLQKLRKEIGMNNPTDEQIRELKNIEINLIVLKRQICNGKVTEYCEEFGYDAGTLMHKICEDMIK